MFTFVMVTCGGSDHPTGLVVQTPETLQVAHVSVTPVDTAAPGSGHALLETGGEIRGHRCGGCQCVDLVQRGRLVANPVYGLS